MLHFKHISPVKHTSHCGCYISDLDISGLSNIHLHFHLISTCRKEVKCMEFQKKTEAFECRDWTQVVHQSDVYLCLLWHPHHSDWASLCQVCDLFVAGCSTSPPPPVSWHWQLQPVSNNSLEMKLLHFSPYIFVTQSLFFNLLTLASNNVHTY